MKRVFSILFAALILFSAQLKADEGMWLLPLLDQLNMGTMTEQGLKLSAEEIYSLNQPSIKDAIIIFGGFCTGEIVSSQGLVFTNHHCGYGSIQSHSSVEHDYLKDGFWAKSHSDELPNPGLFARFLVNIEDVSKDILKDVKDDMTEDERAEAINKARQEVIDRATEGNEYTARVHSFYGDNNFYLVVYETYNDVRLVGAPPSSIGKYGHDTDNWEWPRHTGDFSIFRVYMSPDGKPAAYSEDNVPLKPRHYLPVSIKGVEKDDFAMILGYPGSTKRYMTSYSIDELLNITDPNIIKIRGLRQEILMADMMASQKINIQYASKYSGSSNGWKFAIGEKAGIEKLDVKGKKEAIEARFTDWVSSKKSYQKKYGEALGLIKSSIEERADLVNAQQYFRECIFRGTELPAFTENVEQILKMIADSEDENKDRIISRSMQFAEAFYKDYSPETDRKATAAMIALFINDVATEYHPEFVNIINEKYEGNVESYVNDMFDNSSFTSFEAFAEFLKNPEQEILDNDLAFITNKTAREVYNDLRAQSREFDTNLNKGRRLYIAGLRAMDPELVQYPDANFTMRLTYGTVQPYSPKDAVLYKHYTTMEGVMEKYVPGDYEFDLPADFIEMVKNKEYGRYADDNGYMPVCFLTTHDITGGNSGSPVINAEGELIGLAFDGNIEAMSGDIAFEPDLQRCINVDIRYVLWVIDKYAGAINLIEELDIRE